MKDTYTQDFDLIRDAAQEAGKLALSYWGRSIQKQRKADGSEVTEADHAVDELLAARLRGARPDYGWLSEESAEHNDRLHARRVWIVDPIDGTRAFIMGSPLWGTLIGLLDGEEPVLGLMDQPFTGERFWSGATTAHVRNASGKARRLRTRTCTRSLRRCSKDRMRMNSNR